jgi:hypothetical protein
VSGDGAIADSSNAPLLQRRSRWAWNTGAFVLGFVGAGLLALAVGWCAMFARPRTPRWSEPFEAERWRAAAQASGLNTDRIAMVDDLVQSQRLQRMSRVDVETLLGQPTPLRQFRNHPEFAGASAYYLGPHILLNGRSMYLVIGWDNSGCVDATTVMSMTYD